MFRSNLSFLRRLAQIDLKDRTLTSKVDRLRSAKFVDIKSLGSLDQSDDTQIRLRGWVDSTVKTFKKLSFFHLNDGLSNQKIQVIMSRELEDSLPHNLTYGTSIICTGKLVKSKGKQQSIEFKCDQIEYAGETDHFPFNSKDKSDEWDNIRQHLHLRYKSKHFASLQRLRGKLLVYLNDYLQNKGYLNVTTPIITMNDCEGGGEAFKVVTKLSQKSFKSTKELSFINLSESDDEPTKKFDRYPSNPALEYQMSSKDILKNFKPSFDTKKDESKDEFFGKPTFLTVSGQLHLEAVSLGVNRVYTLSPCFRSENTVSRKHLCEFLMLEIEESYLDSLDVLMNRAEQMCKDLVNYLMNECIDEIDLILSKTHKSCLNSIINDDYKR